MSKELGRFSQIDQYPGLWSAQKGALRCNALKLRDGSICLYSPVLGLGIAARDSLQDLGNVRFLLAPNHYHHKGMAEYLDAFPDANPICSDRARPRLEKQTGLTFGDLSELASLLPETCNLIEPDGLKTGEVWLELSHSDFRVWVVTDAFRGPSGPEGFVSDKIGLLGTFPTYGIQDKSAYRTWLNLQIVKANPTMVVPCHGALVTSPTLAADIGELLS